jgi:hypothetical protein
LPPTGGSHFTECLDAVSAEIFDDYGMNHGNNLAFASSSITLSIRNKKAE